MPSDSDTLQPSGLGLGAPPRRLWVEVAENLTFQAIAAVLFANAATLPLLFGGWLSGVAYALTALLLSCVALAVLGQRWSRSMQGLRATLTQFGTPREGDAAAANRHAGLERLRHGFESAHRRALRRVHRLKAARDTAEHEASAQRDLVARLTLAQRIAHLGSWQWDRESDAISCSDEVYRILGLEARTFHPRPKSVDALLHAEDRRAFRRWMIKLARGTPAEGIDLRVLVRQGDLRHLHLMGEGLINDTGRCVGVTGTVQDSTEQTRAIQQINRLSHFDVLTELPNRSRFHAKLEETLEAARRDGRPFAIMFLDLDHFKRINDALGHAVGDDLLRIIAQRLTRGLRADDMAGPTHASVIERDVCRQGGDEFIVLLNGVATEQEASRAANRLLATLAQPIVLGTQEVFVSASIGIVLYPRDGDDLDTLLKNADVAMSHAKGEGRNRCFFYRESMRAATAQRLSLEHDLRKALEGGQFELYYQPQIEVRTGRIVGIEALIRWNHPTLGLLAPGHFISVAEEAGLIMDIWEWVMVTALIQHNAWLEQGLPAVTIAVNLSSVQFDDPGLADRVQESARLVGVPLDYLELEVTESMLMRDFDATLHTLTALRAMGVKIAIDDFGTGYSSLSYLQQFSYDTLKIDRSFIAGMGEREGGGAAIVQTIVALASMLRMNVVAEGVETPVQLERLRQIGCPQGQGFWFSRPVDQAGCEMLLAAGAPPWESSIERPF